MDRKEALAEYLGIAVEELEDSSYDENQFVRTDENADGEETWLVVTEEEAHSLAVDDIENLVDDIGLDGFNLSESELEDIVDVEWFQQALDESNSCYADDIRSEDDDEFENRLIREAYEEGILSDDDFEPLNDMGDVDYTKLKDDVDLDDVQYQFVERLSDGWDDPIEWFKSNFGSSEFGHVCVEHSLIDIEKLADYIISVDGVANNLARYDGQEVDLGDGWYGYRTN